MKIDLTVPNILTQSFLDCAQLKRCSVRRKSHIVQICQRFHQLNHFRMIPMRVFSLVAENGRKCFCSEVRNNRETFIRDRLT